MDKKLVTFITASYPDAAFTVDAIAHLAECGADAVELGVPFSDPVADGPVIELASQRALSGGFRMGQILEISRQTSHAADLYWMGYFNPFYHRGVGRTLTDAAACGVKGLIIPDLPYEEAQAYAPLFERTGVADIAFVAPTDSRERIATVTQNARGFIYMVAYTGITGAGGNEDLSRVIADVRAASATPLYIGFGVDAATARDKVRGVDGVIVGSALMKILLDDSLTNREKMAKMGELSRVIKETINS